MNSDTILIVTTAVIISSSGILINIFKRGDEGEILYVRDGNSLFVFRLLVPLALITAIAVYFSPKGHIVVLPFLKYAAYILIPAGLLLRWLAVYTLGKAFTVKVSIIKDQALVTSGIYKKIRHPAYSGLLLYYLGLGILMQNWICLLLLIVAPLYAVFFRIKKEERVLLKHFGKTYRRYMHQSYKLIPYLY